MTLQIEYRDLKAIKPYARNARTHPRAQIQKIKASLAEYGWANPMLIADGQLIAGHGRLVSAIEMAESGVAIPRNPDPWKGPVVDLSHLNPTQRRAYVLMDNRSALDGGWDQDMLLMELGDLTDEIDLSLTGFDQAELDCMLHGVGPNVEEGEDDGPGSVPVIPVTAEGDLWILGRHRLLCGDSTKPEHVDRLMNGALADFCFTSPPYGQQRKYKSGGISDWDHLMQGVFSILPTKPTAQLLVNLGLIHQDVEWVPYWTDWIESMRASGWRRFGWYVWDQGFGLPGDFRGRLAPSFEFIFHFNKEIVKPHHTQAKKPENIKDVGNKKHKRLDDRTFDTLDYSPKSMMNTHKIPDSVIRVMRHRGGLGDAGSHPAVFPVDLVSEMLTAFSDPDQLAYEPFCGSGSSLIAAQKNGRSCNAMEISAAYTDVSIRRWEKFAQQEARLDGDGRTFNELSIAREKK